MNHSEVNAQMTDYFEGDLKLSIRALVDAHLDSCERCSREYSEMEQTLTLLRSLPDVEVPAGFSSQVMRRVRSGEGDRRWHDAVIAVFRDLTAFVTSPKFAIPMSAAATAMTIAYVTGTISIDFIPAVAGQAPQQVAKSPRQPQVKVWIRPEASAGTTAGQRIAKFHLTGRHGERPVAGLRAASAGSPELEALFGVPTAEWRVNRVGADGQPLSQEELRLRQLDMRLDLMVASPVRYARAHARLSVAEQELWAQNLAGRAVELGRAEAVTQALLVTRNPDALSLAQDIASEAQIAVPSVVASQRSGSP